MASQAPNMLPLLSQGLEPLNRNQHGNFKVRRQTGLDRVASAHAIPVTVDEFSMVQRHFPIVFSSGENPVPIVLMGLHEGGPLRHRVETFAAQIPVEPHGGYKF